MLCVKIEIPLLVGGLCAETCHQYELGCLYMPCPDNFDKLSFSTESINIGNAGQMHNQSK